MHDFTTKRNALFACLDDASSELKGTTLDQTNSSSALSRTTHGRVEMIYRQGGEKRNKHGLLHLRGKESIFKKPELPISRCLKPKKLPDYEINPQKWKKYSLEDVDISDHTNSSAALDFLTQIEKQNANSDSPEKYEEEQKKIEFKRSSKIRRNLKSLQFGEQLDAEIDSPKLKGSKLVMPEYVVGQKKSSAKKNSLKTSISTNEKKERAAGKLLLSHLQEVEEEEQS